MKIELENVDVTFMTGGAVCLYQNGAEIGRLNKRAVFDASEENGADFHVVAGEILRFAEIKKSKTRTAKQIILNEPATIVIWDTGEKTVVKCQNGEKFDPEKGVALCFMKYCLGNAGRYNETLKSAVANEGAKANAKK